MVAQFEQAMNDGRAKAQATFAALARRSKLAQCLEMQEVLKTAVLNPTTPIDKVSSLVAAWDKLEDRIRILRDKPLPGALTHEKRKTVPAQLRKGWAATALASATEHEAQAEDAELAQAMREAEQA